MILETEKSQGWFILLRLATFVVLFAIVVFWMGYPRFLHLPFVGYSVITLVLTFALTLRKGIKLPLSTSLLVSIQFLCEIVIEAGIIHATGGASSPFSTLFLLTVVSAALHFGLIGTLMVASSVSVTLAFVVWYGLASMVPNGLNSHSVRSVFSADESVFYSTLLHILIFYLIAFVSGFLAERIRTQSVKLAVTSQALKQVRLETDEILRHVSSGLLTVDISGTIVYFNHSAENILEFSEREVRGMLFVDAFESRMPALSKCLMDGLVDGIAYPRREISINARDERVVPLGMSTSVLKDDDGAIKGVVTIFSDLTEAKESEQEMRSADRLAAVGELSASIAHEIRNPLASISGSIEILSKEVKVSGQNARLMDLVVKESHRLSNLLTEFLTYARIGKPTFEKVELCHVITDLFQILFHHGAYHPGINVSLKVDKSIVYVIGNEDQFKQLLLNLAVNACEAIGTADGELSFIIDQDPVTNRVLLTVEDNGPGIDPGDQQQVFTPFFSTKKAGTGLGLAIVHRIADSLNIPLSMVSEINRGTRFQLTIPGFEAQSSKCDISSPASTA